LKLNTTAQAAALTPVEEEHPLKQGLKPNKAMKKIEGGKLKRNIH